MTIVRERPPLEERQARWAVLSIFFLNGVGIASWAAHIPYVKERFALSDAVLGLALLAVAAGSVTTLLMGGRLVARFGSRAVTIAGAFGFCAALPLLLLVPIFPLLIPTLAFFGACIGGMEVSPNVQAFGVEERYKRPIMSSFHALFSSGGLLGAAIAGLSIVPVLFTAAGRTPGIATGTGIAAVATVGYFGFLAGPPLIGFAAQLTSLTGGLALVALFMALIALLARRAAQADQDTTGNSSRSGRYKTPKIGGRNR